ncbi:hypothetical protein [Myroides odoratimimus]|uniref:hypothetical protein n=1 Tax=Myroides odoratimimus TaxID=76832 RepID=UPI0031013451
MFYYLNPLVTIILVLVVQILGYLIFYKKGGKQWRYVLFALVFFLFLIVLPSVFVSKLYPIDEFSSSRCGMVDLGVYLFFWFIGIGGMLVIHLLFLALNKFFYSKKG